MEVATELYVEIFVAFTIFYIFSLAEDAFFLSNKSN